MSKKRRKLVEAKKASTSQTGQPDSEKVLIIPSRCSVNEASAPRGYMMQTKFLLGPLEQSLMRLRRVIDPGGGKIDRIKQVEKGGAGEQKDWIVDRKLLRGKKLVLKIL